MDVAEVRAEGNVVRLRLSRGEELLSRYRDEERAFRMVLEVLSHWRRLALFDALYAVYRVRMRMLRRLAGALLADVQPGSVADELRELARTPGWRKG